MIRFDPNNYYSHLNEESALKLLVSPSKYRTVRYTQDALEALFFLLAVGNDDPTTIRCLINWHHDGSMFSNTPSSTYAMDPLRIQRESYPEVCRAFAYYAENYAHGLNLLTNRICQGHASVPIGEHDSLIKVFLMINPQKALPETKGSIESILAAPGIPPQDIKRFKEMKSELGGKRSWFRW